MLRNNPLMVGVVSLLVGVCGCSPKSTSNPAPQGPGKSASITIVKPEQQAISRVIEQPGTVESFEETILFAKLPGFVGKLEDDPNKQDRPAYDRSIDLGSRVRSGQPLAVLSIPELEEEWQQKNALVKQAEAEIVQSEKALEAARASVAAEQALVSVATSGIDRAQAQVERWQKEVERITKLLNSGVGDSQTLDETKNQLRAAEASRNEANARVISAEAAVKKAVADEAKSRADVTAAQAQLEVTRAEVRRLEALLAYRIIRAPFDGVITRRAVNTGDFVSGTEKRGLFSVARMDPVRVVVQIAEVDAAMVSVGQEARVAVLAAATPPLNGKVVRTSWSLDPGSRSLRTEIDLPNPEGLLRPGMYLQAQLAVQLPSAWAVPVSAVAKVGDDPVIYLVENGKTIRVVAQLLRGDSRHTQIQAYKRPGATDWVKITGTESIANPASAVTDGQTIP